jgi:heme/copper-type cytochrome/quinol oxidase subunit 3
MFTNLMNSNFKKVISQKHSFHLVDPSPYPFFTSMAVFSLVYCAALYMHGDISGQSKFFIVLFGLVCLMFCWWFDVIREGTYEGQHTKDVQTGLRMGMLLFIVSEIMFFFAFFWAFFHSSLNPSIALGGVFPPAYLVVLDPWKIPLLNTVILLTSGATVTYAHHSIVIGDKAASLKGLFVTVILAIIFTLLQAYEYLNSPFSISDSVYGSTFYLTTGFHGFHVFIGTCFLAFCLLRLYKNHFTREHHFGFEAAAWYWHFVDVVWLFLFIAVYWWGA